MFRFVAASVVGVEVSDDPEQPHLAQACTAQSKGDGLPNQIGNESYVWAEKSATRKHTIKGHWYKYDGCQKLSLHDPNQVGYPGAEANYYLGCDGLDCCYGDFSMKSWDIGQGRQSEVSFAGFEDTTELNDNPIAQAEHWHEDDKLPFTSYKIQYDHYITRADSDIITHRINFNATGGIVPPGEILYADFKVQHDIDAFIQTEFKLPKQCIRNNLLKCEDSKVKQWEAMHFKHDYAMSKVQEAAVSV
jgi:hypothetical protein